jgi:hypothetical protein
MAVWVLVLIVGKVEIVHQEGDMQNFISALCVCGVETLFAVGVGIVANGAI